jgi:MFS family permease
MARTIGLHERIPHVKHNFVLNVFDGAVFAFGMTLASRATVLPVFIKKMGGDNLIIGLLPVLWALGFNLPQVLIANYARQTPSKKALMLRTGLIQRLPWLAIALVTLFLLGSLPTAWALAVFLGLFTVAAVGGSLNLPVWFDLVAKLTPVRLRGRLFALRAVLTAVFAMLGGWIVTVVLGAFPYPTSFGVLFLLAFVLTMVSYTLLTQIREEAPRLPPQRIDTAAFLRRLPRILQRDRAYRNFLVADALLISAIVAEAFFAVHALQRFGLPEGYVGRFIVAGGAAGAVGSLLFGYLADRLGHRINLVLAAGMTASACALALLAPSPTVYLLVFVASSFALGLPMISRLPLIVELCAEEDRPAYIALTNALTAPFALTGLLAGWRADRAGYEMVFVAAGALALAAAVWLLVMVPEPRHTTSPSPSP